VRKHPPALTQPNPIPVKKEDSTMQDNPNTSEQEDLLLDAEDWEIAFEPFEGNPGAALRFAFHLMMLKSYLAVNPIRIQTAIEGIDNALEVLFAYTEIHDFSFELFVKITTGTLTVDEEQLLKSLGLEL
jgi:hypothetical protein